jgi:outer membrane protein insertion porin family
MRFLLYFSVVLGMLLGLGAQAFEPFVVKDIRVEGLQRTEAGTIFGYLPVKVGETMTDEKAAQAIRALYGTGFFRDVSLEVENNVLIVMVQERPSIAQIDIIGAKEFNKDDLLKGLRSVDLAEGRIFDRGLLDKAEQELKRQYISRGKYSATITTTVTPLERNRAGITFDIVEGEVAKIRQLNVVGNKVFKESELLSLFKLRTPGLMTWYSKDDQYSKQKLAADLETLRSWYLDRGYLEFNIESTQVSISPDKKDVYISIGITEGPQYTVADLKLAGEMLIPEEEALKLIKLQKGEIFSRTRLTESTKLMSDRLGNDGYAFANVNAVPELNREKQLVSFTFFVDPGRRVYVRRINVSGNTRTRDEVVRREMRQFEGGWYSADRIAASKRRVDKLGYFTEVNVETPSVPGTTDQVDVNVSVTEKPTGNILLGAGYGSTEGVIFSAGVNQANVFGSGNTLGVQVNTSRVNTVYSLSFTQPYWTIDGISRGFDIYDRHYDADALGLGNYKTKTLGGQLRFGIPLTEIDTVVAGVGYEETDINVNVCDPATCGLPPTRVVNYVNEFGNHNTAIMGTLAWARDGRDSLIYPTRGAFQRANLETGLPGGTLQYYKVGYQQTRYFPITRTMSYMINGDIGYGGGLNDKPLPFFRNYYAGGVTSVRGYQTASIGPKDIDGNPTGGSKKLVLNNELLMPFPGLPNDKSVRVSAFVDAGWIGEKFNTSEIRYSYGLGVLWVSPMGPLKVSVANAVHDQPGDRLQKFQFTFGQQF